MDETPLTPSPVTSKRDLIRQLKVEPFLFLYMFSVAISSMSVSQMVQDKICRYHYHKTPLYCVDINRENDTLRNIGDDDPFTKSAILTDVSYFTLYRTAISTVPSIFWSLFIGSWSDKYIHGRKILMCFGALAVILESVILMINASAFERSAYLILLASIPAAFTGGIIATILAVYAYCAATSEPNTRSIRFAIIEVAFWSPQPFGTFIGGQVLGNGDPQSQKQLYNYTAVFIISLVAQLIALFWVIIVINEKRESSNAVAITHREVFESSCGDDQLSVAASSVSDVNYRIQNLCAGIRWSKIWGHIKEIFDFTNIKECINTCIKPRPNHARAQIWLLFLATICILLSYIGAMVILWPYVEKLFSWTAKKYSNVSSIMAVITIAVLVIVLPLLIKKWKVRDSLLGIIGTISLFFQNLVRGTWKTPIGFYFSFIIGTLGGVAPIVIRSRISKLIEKNEQGKVLSLMATIEAITPTIAALFYSFIFGATIDYYTGLAFQIASIILFIPLLILIWIDMRCPL